MKIAKFRKEKGITQAQLAELIGTSQQQIAKIERGVVDPRLSTLRRIAEALGCEVPALFYTPVEFLREIKGVAAENGVKPAELGLWKLNELCQREAGLPSYDPLWERISVKGNSIRLRERK